MKYTIDINAFCIKNNIKTQKQLCEITGLDKSFISTIVKGKSKLPQEQIRKLLDSGEYDTSMIHCDKPLQNSVLVDKSVLEIINNQSLTLRSQQETIQSQQRMLEKLIDAKFQTPALPEDPAGCAGAAGA